MHSRSGDRARQHVQGEFHLRGQNSRLPPLRIKWCSEESLYYGGKLQVLGGPTGMQTRFSRRMSDMSWLKNDPDKVAGGRPFTESFFTTVAVLMAFADAERLVIETVESPVPMTSLIGKSNDFEESSDDFEGVRGEDPDSRPLSGTMKAG